MRCSICRQGEVKPGLSTVTLERGQTIVVIKQVPAEICDICGEYYLSEDIAKKVMEIANRAEKSGTEIEVIRFAA